MICVQHGRLAETLPTRLRPPERPVGLRVQSAGDVEERLAERPAVGGLS